MIMTKDSLIPWLLLPLLAVFLAGLAYGLWPRAAVPAGEGLSAAAIASAITELDAEREAGGEKTLPAESVVFPQDHGTHDNARAEVWEVRAQLKDEMGQPVAVRLSLARFALVDSLNAVANGSDVSAPADADAEPGAAAQPTQRRASVLTADTILAGELVLMAGERMQSIARREQRLSRAALGLAGAGQDKAGNERVWIEHWALSREASGTLVLQAESEGVGLELRLSPEKPPVVIDREALAGAPAAEADASVRFYSQSRLRVSGTLRVSGEERSLHGLGWLDHGWGDFAEVLAGGRRQLAANRFQLQLDDGSEIACLHLRRRAGGGTPIPSCALIGVDGETLLLQRRDLRLAPSDGVWVADDGVAYPLGWRLLIPARGLDLAIEPQFDDPAAALSPASVAATPRSWRGAVSVTGWRESDAISGGGQMDLNGYGHGSPLGT